MDAKAKHKIIVKFIKQNEAEHGSSNKINIGIQREAF